MHPLTCAASKPSTHASHTAPTLPGRVHTRSLSTLDHLHPTLAPGRPQSCCPHVLGEGWRLPGSQETNFGSTSTCSLRSSQCYHARLVSLLAWHPARESDVEDQVPPPQAPPPFALTAAQPSPPAPPYVCRVQPKHPGIASRAQPARAVPVPRPESTRVPISHVRATGRLMGTRVLRAGSWYRPGWLGAGCDARVLGLHAAHVRGCRRARMCRGQGKGWR